MSTEHPPPAIEISSPASEEQENDNEPENENFTSGTRTPRPYHHEADEIRQDDYSKSAEPIKTYQVGLGPTRWKRRSRHVSLADSDSGTEADDESHRFVKALPAPHPRLRKGLKTGESNADVLLTPSQLDDEGRRLSQDYFRRSSSGREKTPGSVDEQKAEREKLLKIRLAEFARRSSEVALMAGIVLCVLCGQGVLRTAYQWRRELSAHVGIITALILVYPVKLSIVDSGSNPRKLWQRFRVPVSFDPATVLYPTLLPVLVAVSVSPANAGAILPNVILGLSSLPQRLFPRSSRLGGMNVVHWFVSIVPLIVSERTAWPSKWQPDLPYCLKNDSAMALMPETLASLYPLHHALLQPLQYLTTTSLLISEVHLLSAALINVLLLAESPQMVILKACLWIGGICLFLPCSSLLRWNVTLMRVPKWKFRQPGHPTEGRLSLIDAVSDLINVQRATAAFTKKNHHSDADEDEPIVSIKQKRNMSMSNLNRSVSNKSATSDSKSIHGRDALANGTLQELRAHTRSRGTTLPLRNMANMLLREPNNRRKESSSSLLWYLHLTAAQAERRKWIYAACIYATILTIILLPVRYYVLEKALAHYEPIGWALGYLLGQISPLRSLVISLDLESWIAIPSEPIQWHSITVPHPLAIPTFRSTIGAANTRLALIAYWALVLLCGLLAVFSLTAFVEVDTRRKVFHGVMVAMMLPSTFIDPCACALALALILAVFLLLEVIRAGQVPPLGNVIGRFVAPYVDGRDLRGPVVVSHFFLLIGCAIPLWFSLASIPRTAEEGPWMGWDLRGERREVAMVAGVICVGMGDAAASLFGRRYGRHKWVWVGGKSLEGSAAFAVAVTVGLVATKVWLVVGGWNDNTGALTSHAGGSGAVSCVCAWIVTTTKAVICACAASFMEAVLTGANDNVVVPVALWLLVKGVRL